MTKNIAWTKSEICKLFSLVEEYKQKNKSLLKAFELFATKFARKTNSVRNFYYSQLKIFENEPNLAKDFNINLEYHKKGEQKFFSSEELELSMSKIDTLLKKGFSVRKACQQVAGGNIAEMLRLQNKYHSEKHKKFESKQASKVLVMPARKAFLSESEINSLFLGLVRLVKKSAEESAEQNLGNQIKTANFELRKSIKCLAEKEREVTLLRKKFELLSNEKNKLKEEIECLRSQNVELLKAEPQKAKMTGLKKYISKFSNESAIKS